MAHKCFCHKRLSCHLGIAFLNALRPNVLLEGDRNLCFVEDSDNFLRGPSTAPCLLRELKKSAFLLHILPPYFLTLWLRLVSLGWKSLGNPRIFFHA